MKGGQNNRKNPPVGSLMNTNEVVQCGVREQHELSVLADRISKVVSGHDSSIPDLRAEGKSEIKQSVSVINSIRARVGMEIKLLEKYQSEIKTLLSAIEDKMEILHDCSDPWLLEIAGERAEKLALSRTVYTQLSATVDAAIGRYSEYAETLKEAVHGMSLMLEQSGAIELTEIYLNVRKAAVRASEVKISV